MELLNNSGQCLAICPNFTYAKKKYGTCQGCQSNAYDGGTIWSMNASACISTVCKYIAVINNTTVCVDTSDPPPSAYCPFYTVFNSSSYNCTNSCSGSYPYYLSRVCYAACPSTAPLVPSAGSYACQTSCSASLYIVNGSSNQCISSCDLPLGRGTG